jgi:hypothetical protein
MLEVLDANKLKLLQEINKSWPQSYRLTFDGNTIKNLQSHLLIEELTSFVANQSCCLPFFREREQQIAWFNIATNADELQGTIQTLRCWLLPSYGWEDERGWIVTSESAVTGVAQAILSMSPPGFCRWKSKLIDFPVIAKKLSQIRALEKARPEIPPNGPPPLIQIRQQFVTALVAGDRSSAERAVQLIDTHQLDTADNSLFMWIRFWFTFGEYSKITKHKDIHRLAQLRIPAIIKHCILRAFYFEYLERFDWEQDADSILASYKLDIEPAVGGLVGHSSLGDGFEVLRLLACHAIIKPVADLAKQLSSFNDVSCLLSRLEATWTQNSCTEPSLEDQFWNARAQKNWVRLQEVGASLVEEEPESYSTLLRQSLKFNANPELLERLDSLERGGATEATSPTERTGNQVQVPKSWAEWLQLAKDSATAELGEFLAERQSLVLDELAISEIQALSQGLEDLYLIADFKSDQAIRQVLLMGLPELMQDLVNETQFPRDILVPAYTNVFRLWSELKCGSAHPPDSQVLLNLADGILTYQRELESEIVTQFEEWWTRSPVKANVPFLLGVVDLLNSKGTEEQCGNFWITGATYLQSNPKYLTAGERSLWRQIGLQIFDQSTIDEYLPLPSDSDGQEDPLTSANLKKVAIVSMREPQAKNAAELIEQRTGASVHLVTGKSAGAQTDNAVTAEVILFVWRATSHAIFRAFDKIEKERVAYVQGTGAGSILLALERWIAERL